MNNPALASLTPEQRAAVAEIILDLKLTVREAVATHGVVVRGILEKALDEKNAVIESLIKENILLKAENELLRKRS